MSLTTARLDREAELATVFVDGSITPLRGMALLEKIRYAGDVSKGELATMCGYADPDGRIYFTDFYENLLQAKASL